jgi:hypothetical protein
MIAGESQYEDPWSDNFILKGTIAKGDHSAGIDGGEGASWSGHSDLEKTIAKEGHSAEIDGGEGASRRSFTKIKVGSCIFW